MLCDAGLTVAWQEPVSALYARIVQDGLGDDLRDLELATPSARDLAALRSLAVAAHADGVPRPRAAADGGARRSRRADPHPADRRELRRRRRQRPGIAAQGPGDLRRLAVPRRARDRRDRRPPHDVPRALPADRQAAARRRDLRRDALRALLLPRAAAEDRRPDDGLGRQARRLRPARAVGLPPALQRRQADHRLRALRARGAPRRRARRDGGRHDTCGRRGRAAQARGRCAR